MGGKLKIPDFFFIWDSLSTLAVWVFRSKLLCLYSFFISKMCRSNVIKDNKTQLLTSKFRTSVCAISECTQNHGRRAHSESRRPSQNASRTWSGKTFDCCIGKGLAGKCKGNSLGELATRLYIPLLSLKRKRTGAMYNGSPKKCCVGLFSSVQSKHELDYLGAPIPNWIWSKITTSTCLWQFCVVEALSPQVQDWLGREANTGVPLPHFKAWTQHPTPCPHPTCQHWPRRSYSALAVPRLEWVSLGYRTVCCLWIPAFRQTSFLAVSRIERIQMHWTWNLYVLS